MSCNDVMTGRRDLDASALNELTEQLPGVIFQLKRRPDGHVHFPYLAGNGTRLAGIDRRQLARDARPALQERLNATDYPRLMASIERSARYMTPLNTKFQLRLSNDRTSWIAVRAQPRREAGEVLWHGMMLDVTEQVAEESRLRHLSDTDDLTGVANRRRLMERLEEEISLSNRHGTPLSVMMLDLDHFKLINDTWGHLQGDHVLSNLATLCRQLLREEDLVARLGGEEFVLLIPLTPLARCRALAERLCQRIAEHDFGIGTGAITVSIGLAEYRQGDSRDALIARADRQLYVAKRHGRNRVTTGA